MVKSTSENAPQNSHEDCYEKIATKKKSGKTAGARMKDVRKRHTVQKDGGLKAITKKAAARKAHALGSGTRNKGRLSASSSTSTAVFLVGFMGAGKTTVGRALGQRLNWIFEDLDNRIAQAEGRSVAEIFHQSGEQAFRQSERKALEQALQELQAGAVKVIALGGGAFAQPSNAALLETVGVPIVFLDAPVEDLWQRCCEQSIKDGSERPLLHGIDQFRELHASRRKAYLGASLRVETGGRSIEAIVDEIVVALNLDSIALRIEQGEVE